MLTPLFSSDVTRQGSHRSSDTISLWAAHQGHQTHIHVACGFHLCHPWHSGDNAAAATRHQPHHPCSGQPLRILAGHRRLPVAPEIGYPLSNTTRGQRHIHATSHPWQPFAVPPHGLTTIRHIPVQEIRASWSPAVSGPATTLTPGLSMAGPGPPCTIGVRANPSARQAGWHILAPDPACPAVRGRAIHKLHRQACALGRARSMTCRCCVLRNTTDEG